MPESESLQLMVLSKMNSWLQHDLILMPYRYSIWVQLKSNVLPKFSLIKYERCHVLMQTNNDGQNDDYLEASGGWKL